MTVVGTVNVRWIGQLPDRCPPADHTNHELIAAVLRDKPGDWHALPDLAPSYTVQIRSGVNRAYRPAGSYEACARNGVLYARYTGRTATTREETS